MFDIRVFQYLSMYPSITASQHITLRIGIHTRGRWKFSLEDMKKKYFAGVIYDNVFTVNSLIPVLQYYMT